LDLFTVAIQMFYHYYYYISIEATLLLTATDIGHLKTPLKCTTLTAIYVKICKPFTKNGNVHGSMAATIFCH